MSDEREAPPRPVEEPRRGASAQDICTALPSRLLDGLRAPELGFMSRQARHRLDEVGPNDPAPARRRIALLEILAFFAN
jgi:hypothetical protein